MNISVPVTDYIPASVLTTLNDIVVRGASIPARQPGLLRAIGTRIMGFSQAAGGEVAYTGCGFNPSMIILVCHDVTGANLNYSIGFDTVGLRYAHFVYDDGITQDSHSSYSAYVRRSAGNILSGTVIFTGADGFSILWVLTGAVSLNGFYVALP